VKGKGKAPELPPPPPRSRRQRGEQPPEVQAAPQPPTDPAQLPKGRKTKAVATKLRDINSLPPAPPAPALPPAPPVFSLPIPIPPKPRSDRHVIFEDSEPASSIPRTSLPSNSPLLSDRSWPFSATSQSPPLSPSLPPSSAPDDEGSRHEDFNMNVSGTEPGSVQSVRSVPHRSPSPRTGRHSKNQKSSGPAGSKRGKGALDIWTFFQTEGTQKHCTFCMYDLPLLLNIYCSL
jgi:hypothetical protein